MKEKYKVENTLTKKIVRGAVKKGLKGVVKVSITTAADGSKNKKKSALDADAEIEQYMKELGFI